MVKGQKIVCVNDNFSLWVRKLYKALPVKDVTYTIREVYLGRETIKGSEQVTVGLLLEEVVNPVDPTHKEKQELGFNAERFAPLQTAGEELEETVEREEPLLV